MDKESTLTGCVLGVIVTIVVFVACIFGTGLISIKSEQPKPKQVQAQPESIIAQGYADVGRIEAQTRQQQAQAPIVIAILQQLQVILVELAGIVVLLAYAYRIVKCSSS